MPLPSLSTSLPGLRGTAPLSSTAACGETPQWYRADARRAGAQHPLLNAVVEACRHRWGRDDLTLDCQTLDLRPGTFPGLPMWHRLPASSVGEVAVVCLGAESLWEIADDAADAGEAPDRCRERLRQLTSGHRLPHDQVCFLAAGATVRFRAATLEQPCVVALVRPRDGVPLIDRPRHGARVFTPSPKATDHPLPPWALDRPLTFHSHFSVVAAMPDFSQRQIAAEPVLAGASPAFARAIGGPITQAWLDRLPAEWHGEDVIIQVKRDELSPGWWPCLVGWHMDGTSRAEKRSDGTPDLRNPVRMAEQVASCIGPAAATGMLLGTIALPETPLGAIKDETGGVWQRLLLDAIASGRLTRTAAPHDTVFTFGWGAFHTCSRSTTPGWRMFLKAMRGRGDQPANRRPTRATISWASDGDDWPTDPCGVFPQELPT